MVKAFMNEDYFFVELCSTFCLFSPVLFIQKIRFMERLSQEFARTGSVTSGGLRVDE